LVNGSASYVVESEGSVHIIDMLQEAEEAEILVEINSLKNTRRFVSIFSTNISSFLISITQGSFH
jgi:hypothetical protein